METVVDYNLLVLALIYLSANLFAFVLMGFDKSRSIALERRLSEAHFLFLSICFCALGVLVGMLFFRHKIGKFYFFIGVPLALLENLGLFFLFWKYF
jgi:uncharacterized membrane protein YsdA (DUF1294 family)